MSAGILYAIFTILNNLTCIIHIITTHKSSVLLLQMDLSIFTPPPPQKKELKTLQYLVKQLLNKFNVEISDAEEPPAFQHFMHNLKKHNKPECIPACEIHDTSTTKNFLHPDFQEFSPKIPSAIDNLSLPSRSNCPMIWISLDAVATTIAISCQWTNYPHYSFIIISTFPNSHQTSKLPITTNIVAFLSTTLKWDTYTRPHLDALSTQLNKVLLKPRRNFPSPHHTKLCQSHLYLLLLNQTAEMRPYNRY